MASLEELLDEAAAADGFARIELRDPIASFGAEAIVRLEPWLVDYHLGAFAVRAIAAAATVEPGRVADVLAALERARNRCAKAVQGDIDDAITRLRGPRQRRSSTSGRGETAAEDRGGDARSSGSVAAAGRELDGFVSRWRADGSRPQAAMAWSRSRWLAAFPDYRDVARDVPEQLDRAALRSLCRGAATDERSAKRAIFAVMAWGHGSNGNGPYRAGPVLSARGTPERLRLVAGTLSTDGTLAAYRRLADGGDCRLKGLGPAFGTKYLYFCQPEGQSPTALIHDRLVSEWLLGHAGLALSSEQWSVRTYGAYLDQMEAWADDLGCSPDDVELCIFQAMAVTLRNQWKA